MLSFEISFTQKISRVISATFLCISQLVEGAEPLWWRGGHNAIIQPQQNFSGNLGVANVGQAKWVAMNALSALRIQFPAVAIQIESDLVGPGNPIESWDSPMTVQEKASMRAPLLLGQLKAVAAPFYTRLHAAVPGWLEAQRVSNRIPNTGTFFPWTATTSDDANRSPATIGQLKAVFSLSFEDLKTFDTDQDGLPDVWELDNGLDPNDNGSSNPSQGGEGDSDGDGVSNKDEARDGTKANDPNDFAPGFIIVLKEKIATAQLVESITGTNVSISWDREETSKNITSFADFSMVKNDEDDGIPFPVNPDVAKAMNSTMVSRVPFDNGLAMSETIFNLAHNSRSNMIWHRSVKIWVHAPLKEAPQVFRFLKNNLHTSNDGYSNTERKVTKSEVLDITVPANFKYSEPIELGAEAADDPLYGRLEAGITHTVFIALQRASIVAASGMVDHLGGYVESTLPLSPLKHFVTPKISDEINDPYVILQAEGITADLIDPDSTAKIYQWEGGDPVSGDPLKRRVSRESTGKTEVKILTIVGSQVASHTNVWVTWADVSYRPGSPTVMPSSYTSGGAFKQIGYFGFKIDCKPQSMFVIGTRRNVGGQSIFDINDVPDFLKRPKPALPGYHPWVKLAGGGAAPLADGAAFRYDVSRQVRGFTATNSSTLTQIVNEFYPDIPSYPDEEYTGNDDPSMDGEMPPFGPPYGVHGEGHDQDFPSMSIPLSTGVLNDSALMHAQFKEFVRMQINGKWYICSNVKKSEIKLKFRKVFLFAQDNFTGYPEIWISGGSVCLEGNGDFPDLSFGSNSN